MNYLVESLTAIWVSFLAENYPEQFAKKLGIVIEMGPKISGFVNNDRKTIWKSSPEPIKFISFNLPPNPEYIIKVDRFKIHSRIIYEE